MPRCIITQNNLNHIKQEISDYYKYNKPIEITTRYNNWMQEIIMALNKERIPYKLYNLGAGVKTVTTDTTTCPLCKKELSKCQKKD